MKTFLMILSIAVAAGSCYFGFNYYQKALNAQEVLNEERYNKMLAEEELQKANIKITSLKADVSRANKRLSANTALLEQTKAINKNLKGRLDKAFEFKVLLENKIDELEKLSAF